MNTTHNIFFTVESEDPIRLFRLKVEWQENQIKILILENTNAWTATVTNEDIETLANTLECNFSVYKNDLKQYLSKNNSSVSYNIVNNQFIIYRNEKKLRIKYFVQELIKVNFEKMIETFLNDLLGHCEILNNKVEILEHEKIKAEMRKITYEEKCKEFVKIKQKVDLQTYSSFLLLLNKKKEQISFLTELKKVEKNKASSIAHTITSKNWELKTNSKHKLSDSESNNEEDYNTDDEKSTKVDNDKSVDFDNTTQSLDYLAGDDSPPPVNLPKRIKKENNATLENIPSSSGLFSKKQSDEIQMDNDTDEDSDSYKMSTQELLDRM